MTVPFFRPSITEAEINEVVDTLRSGWLTTGPKTKRFEEAFAQKVGAQHAVALNSCTAALHLALEAIGVTRGDMVLVPTMTFAATAEVVRYFDATPVLVDVDPLTLTIDVEKARQTLVDINENRATAGLKPPYGPVKAIIPVHYGGQMADVFGVQKLATEFGIRTIEDAAHCLPAFARTDDNAPWITCGSTSDVVCFSFYANKTITTGEGGMAVTNDAELASRMRIMSLHGMSKDAWRRFEKGASWYYEIVAPGFKYNLTDIASSIGLQQLIRADDLFTERSRLASTYTEQLRAIEGLGLPVEIAHRRSSWHLYPIRIKTGMWSISRNEVIDALKAKEITTSVHWMPLHMHPYYRDKYGYAPELFPVAQSAYGELISLPLFPGMTSVEMNEVTDALAQLWSTHRR